MDHFEVGKGLSKEGGEKERKRTRKGVDKTTLAK